MQLEKEFLYYIILRCSYEIFHCYELFLLNINKKDVFFFFPIIEYKHKKNLYPLPTISCVCFQCANWLTNCNLDNLIWNSLSEERARFCGFLCYFYETFDTNIGSDLLSVPPFVITGHNRFQLV